MQNLNCLGYIKYHGNLVEEGFLDARKAATVLIGFDEIIRYFIHQESKAFKDFDFEIPVRIQKGSWLAFIPENIQDWLVTSGGLAFTTYVVAAVKKMADNDFKDVGVKDIFKRAFQGLVWVIRISTHVKTINKRKFENVRFRNNNKEVGIINEMGEILYVPIEYLDFYTNCPEGLFSKVAEVIEPERELEIGLGNTDEKVMISNQDKAIFYTKKDDDDIVLPELVHGMYIELEGHVTRGNENSNTIGFFYSNHILTCKPREGSIIKFRNHLFSNVLIKGYVNRIDENGIYKDKKPRIDILELIEIISEREKTLFD